MICYVLARGKQHLGPHVVVGYGIKIFWPGLFITSPDHLAMTTNRITSSRELMHFCQCSLRMIKEISLVLFLRHSIDNRSIAEV